MRPPTAPTARRRRALGVGITLSLALTACTASPAADPGSVAAGGADGRMDTGLATGASVITDLDVTPSGQAPQLAELVTAGDLPDVAERMPAEPVVILGPDGPGRYGGEMTLAMLDADDDSTIRRYLGYEPLVRWDADWSSELQPGVARAWEVSDDATTFTFHLHQGIRWSDGEPFTAADIVFGYDEVIAHEEITPGPTEYLMDPAGSFPEVTALDEHTVELAFTVPHGLFLMQLARAEEEGKFHRYPRHYLEQFHADHNPEVVELAAAEGYDDWVDLFNARGNITLGSEHDARWTNPELPVLGAWVIETPAYSGTRVTATRNPYYWKVDTDGNQLPYIDRVVFDVFADQEVIAFRAAAGNISYQERHFDHDFRPLLAESMATGGFSLVDVISTDMNTLVLSFNHLHPDEEVREVFTDLDFKVGLSHALDRGEIIELVYFGQGEPAQTAPRPESPYYHERLATQHLDHDVDLANEHLDRVLPDTDDAGRRLGPDGTPFTFSVDVATDRSIEHVSALELVQQHWSRVGVTLEINTMDRDLRNERRDAGLFDLYVRDGSAGLQDAILRPHWYMPFGSSGAYASQWGEWYLEGEGTEPPADSLAWDQWELYDEILVTADPTEQAALMQRLLDVSADAFWTIGVSTSPNRVGVKADGLMNAPDVMYEASAFNNPGPAHVASFWWADSSDAEVDGLVGDDGAPGDE